jgi:glucosamine-6-phosphate deaminase
MYSETPNPINLIAPEDLGKGSGIKLDVCDTEHDMYWKMAMEVLEIVEENNKIGKKTVMIVPYGPIGPYSRLVYLIKKRNVSLKNCIFINMDEYLTDDGKYLSMDNPLSFRGGMNRIFYSQLPDELNVLPENRIFPEPGNEKRILEIIEENGGLDMSWGGVGINGHFAFNEPPEPGEVVSNEEFLNRPTRVLAISRETKTINSFMNCGADLNAIPDYCITVGMKEMFMAKKVRMCMPRGWNAGALRKILHDTPTAAVPCSLFQSHPDAVLFAADVALEKPISKIVVYNK